MGMADSQWGWRFGCTAVLRLETAAIAHGQEKGPADKQKQPHQKQEVIPNLAHLLRERASLRSYSL